MSDVKIALRQIEQTDMQSVRGIFDSPFQKIMDLPTPEEILISDEHQYYYAITAHKGVSDIYIVGVCGLSAVDWISRHAKLIFVMVDKDKHMASIQSHPSTRSALSQILRFAFDELGLNKIWIEIMETNKCLPALEDMGFVVEGVRREGVFKHGKFLSSMILSLTAAEYGDKS